MTLILAVGNPRWTVLVSDRRLTSNGKLVEDESNKAIVVLPTGARLAAAFTGVAAVGSFSTHWWLLDELFESMKPDGMLHLERLADGASKKFRTLRVPPKDKILTVLFGGYVADSTVTYPMVAWVSNVPAPATWSAQIQHVGDFAWSLTRHVQPGDYANSYCIGAGMIAAVSQQRIDDLADMAKRDLPPRAIIDRAIGTIRDAGRHGVGAGLIGAQCTSILLSSDPAVAPQMDYHTAVVSKKAYGPSVVSPHAVWGGLEVEATDAGFAALPQVGRNQPCPCGSGQKYKRCHGK